MGVLAAADVLKVLIWHTPKGIIDEGGKMLEGYLNFNISLLSPPENNQMSVSASPTDHINKFGFAHIFHKLLTVSLGCACCIAMPCILLQYPRHAGDQ